MKNSMQVDVETFMKACGQAVESYPQHPGEKIRELRKSLMLEELTGKGELLDSMENYDIVGVADGLADVLYVVFGTAAAYGIDIQQVFDEIHRSNMSKVGPDGTVIRREDGKILKPDTYFAPNLTPILVDQSTAA